MPSSKAARRGRRGAAGFLALAGTLLGGAGSALLGNCGPFTDVAADNFCPFVLEIFYLGITTGTTPTTYDPASNVSRLQMAAFLSRTVDGVLKRGSRRAALDQFWTTQNGSVLGLTTVGGGPGLAVSDGADIWVVNTNDNSTSRVRGSDGKLLETWTDSLNAYGIVSAMGRIFLAGDTPGKLYRIDPSQPAGAVTTVASNLGTSPFSIAFDGTRLWTGNLGSVSIVTPGAAIPWTVTTVTAGFGSQDGILFDGTNIWTTKDSPGAILKLDAAGAILQTVTVGASPRFAAFDGGNIWVPSSTASTISVVRPSSGTVLATLTGNGMNGPTTAAFDGQRILVTNFGSTSVSLWKAADLTPIGSFGVGATPIGACSDGIAFWITLVSTNKLARF